MKQVRELIPSAKFGRLKKAATWVLFVALMLTAILVLALNLHQRINQTGLYRKDYEGVVIDKYTNLRETKLGSTVERKLIIKDDSGATFTVVANGDLYDRAEKGMWIKKRGEHVELSWPGPKAVVQSSK
jgi:hypothetical protein